MADAGTFTDSLKLLAAKGQRYGTVMDLGCADGHFFLQHHALGPFAGAVPVNVDANPIYESSLKAIKGTLGEALLGAFPELEPMFRDGDTVLIGQLADQPALHGVLAQVEALGLELVEVWRLRRQRSTSRWFPRPPTLADDVATRDHPG